MVVTRSGRRALAPVRDTKRGVNQTPLKTPGGKGRKAKKTVVAGTASKPIKRVEEKVLLFASPAKSRSPLEPRRRTPKGKKEEEEVDAAPRPPPPQCAAAAAPTANGPSTDESFGSDSTPSLSGVADGSNGNGAIFRLLPPATDNSAGAGPTIGLGRQLNSSYDSHGTEASTTSTEAREFRAGAVALLREGNLSVEVDHDDLVDALLEESFDGEDATHDAQELADELEKLERIVERAETNLEPIEAKPSFDEVCPAVTSETYDASVEEEDEEDEDLPSLDDFEIIGQLGKGGTATVFHAIELETGREVALKVVKMENDGDDIMSEIDIHEDLCHPNVVELMDYFFTYERVCVESEAESDDSDDESKEDVKSLVMVLELVTGEALFDVIRDSDDGYLPEHVARRYFRDMMESV